MIPLTSHIQAPSPRFKLNLRVLSVSKPEGTWSFTKFPSENRNREESSTCSLLMLNTENAKMAPQKTMDILDEEGIAHTVNRFIISVTFRLHSISREFLTKSQFEAGLLLLLLLRWHLVKSFCFTVSISISSSGLFPRCDHT